MNDRAKLTTWPQSAKPSGRPMPKKLSAANDSTTDPMLSEIRTSVGNMALGMTCLIIRCESLAPLARAART